MTSDPDLNNAYALETVDDAKRLYAQWAKTYDSTFGDAQGYVLPREVVRAFVDAGGSGPVLDVGAGTGLVGEGLVASGVSPVDAVDLSEEMLAVAAAKKVYRNQITADITGPLNLESYRGIVSAGTFTLGHVGPEAIKPLLRIAEPGCLFVISVNAVHFATAGFSAFLAEIETEITDSRFEDVRIYTAKADLAHRHDQARLITFNKI
ncbi:class I SAM-dependent methyltransferase [Granulosicoccus sp.]|nr:class I SAM-dependent methyltransferase [Granulosicoccus sp.]